MTEETPDKDQIRFLKYVQKQENGCWQWCGAKAITGYGNVFYKGTTWLAHRASYLIFGKPRLLLMVFRWLTLVMIGAVLIRTIYLKRPVKRTMELINELMGWISPEKDATYPNLPGSPSEKSEEEQVKG
jgi:hypothetical protein